MSTFGPTTQDTDGLAVAQGGGLVPAIWQTASTYLAPALIDGLNRRPSGDWSWIEPIEGTLLMADISGFTKMSERLAEIGKEGAEWLTSTINLYFQSMLDTAAAEGGTNLKFGGDALLLLFTGPGHAERGVRVGMRMQAANRRFPAVRLNRDRIRLKMSIGLHSGRFWSGVAGLPGQRMQHFILGADASMVTRPEAVAEAGEVCITQATRDALASCRSQPKEDVFRVLWVPHRPSRNANGASPLSPRHSAVLPYLPPPIATALETPEQAALIAGEHRKAAVIFIHVEGIDALLEREGPALLLAELQEYVSRVVTLAEKYGGFLAGNDIYTEGIKLIVVFGAPVTREGDAANALRLALDLNSQLPDMGLHLNHRIGINNGYVFAGDVGSSYRRDYTIMGDAVNLSARLMSAAKTGEILASARIVEDAGAGFVTSSPPPITVKGKRNPIPIRLVEAETAVVPAIRVDRTAALVGREAELEQLRAVCREVEAGSARSVAVQGEAGIGKSRLTADFQDYLQARGWRLCRARCQSHLQDTPFAPWAEAMGNALGVDSAAGAVERSEQIRTAIESLVPGLAEIGPLLNAIIPRALPETAATRALDEESRGRRLFELVTALIAAAAEKAPLALVIEDVHWSDKSTRELTSHVARSLGAERVLLYLTARTLEGLDFRFTDERHMGISLGELSEDAAVQLVRTVMGVPSLPAEIAAALLRRARGNPLFLEEIARSLRDSGELQRLMEVPAYRLAEAAAEVHIPDRVQTLLMARIDGLAGITKEVLRAAAVIGSEFDLPSLRGILEADIAGGGLAPRVEELVDHDLVQRDPVAGSFRFRHALIQDVAYGSLLYSRRRRLHQRAGSYYEITNSGRLEGVYETLVHHYARGGNKPRTLLYSVKAADKARAVFANGAAIDHYRRAVTLAPDVSARDARDAGSAYMSPESIHTSLGDVLELTGAHGEAVRYYGAALAVLAGAAVSARGALRVRRPASQAFVRSAMRTGRTTRRAFADICRKVGIVHERLDDYGTAQSWFLNSLATLPTNSPLERSRGCLGMFAVHFRAGEYGKAREWCLRGLRNAREGRGRSEEAHAYNGLGIIDYAKGLLRRALRYHLRALAIYEDINDLNGRADTLINLALDHDDLGEWSLAIQRHEECLEVATRTGDIDSQAIARNNLGEVFLRQGEIAAAKSEFRWTIDARTKLGNIGISALAEANLGQCLMHEGRFAEARLSFENSLRDFRKIKVPAFEADVNTRLAALDLAEGKTDQALNAAQRALAISQKLSIGPAEEKALLVIGKIATARGDWKRAEQTLLQSAQIARRAGDRYGEGKALAALGGLWSARALKSSGAAERRRAAAQLRRAENIFRRLGASLDAAATAEVLQGLPA